MEETAAAGVCQALAAGTFLYVATMDILPAELKGPEVRPCLVLEKSLSLLVTHTRSQGVSALTVASLPAAPLDLSTASPWLLTVASLPAAPLDFSTAFP